MTYTGKNKYWIMWAVSILLAVFILGFAISSGAISELSDSVKGQIIAKTKYLIEYHKLSMARYARHYLLFNPQDYSSDLSLKPVNAQLLLTILSNALFNAMFQPLFLCVFTPQTVLNFILFPFFIYGSIKYFKSVPLMILVFLAIAAYSGLYGSVVEALIRHRLTCDLIYLLIGLAGFTTLITKSS